MCYLYFNVVLSSFQRTMSFFIEVHLHEPSKLNKQIEVISDPKGLFRNNP